MNKIKGKFVLSKKILIVSLIVLSFLFIKSTYDIIKIFSEINSQNSAKSYTNSSEINYDVFLTTNEFIPDPIYPSGKTYISELVNKISMTMKYKYDSLVSLPLSYQHQINATLVGLYNEDPSSDENPVIWEKTTSIKEMTPIYEKNGKKIIITETFDIDISKYSIEMSNFINHFSIPTVAYLEIRMPVTIKGSNKNYSIDEKYDIIAKIPLMDKVFRIDAELQKNEIKNFNTLDSAIVYVNDRSLIIYAIIILISGIMIIISIVKIVKLKPKSNYSDALQKIKNDYGEIIVKTNSMVDVRNFIPVSIVNFEEMENLSNCLSVPIMLYEKKNISCFYIVKDNIIYVLIMKD